MTRAQNRLAVLVEWIEASSASERTPLGHTLVRGPWAIFVPQALSLPPTQPFAPEHLPLYLPEQQAIPGLPSFVQAPPRNQPPARDRLHHLIWACLDGRFEGALLALTDPTAPLQSVLDRQAPSLDLDACLALFLPVWVLTGDDRVWAWGKLPLVR